MAQPEVSNTGLVTGEAVLLDLRPARLGSRSIAAILDLLAEFIALWIVLAMFAGLIHVDTRLLRALLIIVVVLFLLGYPIAAQTFWHGRTLGKAALGIRAVRLDGGTLRVRHAAVRTVVGLLEFPLGIAVLSSLLSSTGRRLGDFYAGTVVVHDRIPVLGRIPIVMPPPLVNWATGADLSGIDDRLAGDVRSFLGRAAMLRPEVRWGLANAFAGAATARISPPPPPGAPAEHVLHAIIAERQRRDIERRFRYAAPPTAAPAFVSWPPTEPPPPYQPMGPATTNPPPDDGGFVMPS